MAKNGKESTSASKRQKSQLPQNSLPPRKPQPPQNSRSSQNTRPSQSSRLPQKTQPSQKSRPPRKSSPKKRRSRRKQKPGWLTYLIVALTLLAGSCFMEWAAYHIGDITLLVGAVSPVVIGVVVAISEDFFKSCEDDETPTKDDGLFSRLAMGLRNMKNRIWTNTKLTVLFVGVAYLLVCTALAANHTGGRVINAAVDVVKQLTSYEEQAVNTDDTSDFSDAPDASPESSIPSEELPSETPKAQPSKAVSSKYVILLEPDRDERLSDSERRALYYFTGKYGVKEEGSDEDIYSAVSARVAALVGEAQEDKFNRAPEDDENCTAAMEASEDEKKMETSEDLDGVIGKREAVYKEAPGAEIAKLIAENYNGYSLAYYSIDGSETTIEYYWNKSLIWYHNCLTFQSSPEDISEILNRIGTRYQDLALIQKYGSDEQIRATKLSEAYNSLSKYYGVTG